MKVEDAAVVLHAKADELAKLAGGWRVAALAPAREAVVEAEAILRDAAAELTHGREAHV